VLAVNVHQTVADFGQARDCDIAAVHIGAVLVAERNNAFDDQPFVGHFNPGLG
jgi:hypothetical protein